MTSDELKKHIRDIPDFPKPGIVFKDITPLLGNARALAATVDGISEHYLGKVDLVLGIESRGFIVGAPVAYRLGVGLTIARKPGKLPFKTIGQKYDLEYGIDSIEMHEDALASFKKVLIVDDLLATGGTAEAAVRLIEKLGGSTVGCAFVIELAFLNGRHRLAPVDCFSLITYD
jgi:adenine phosphoribosyltransferase